MVWSKSGHWLVPITCFDELYAQQKKDSSPGGTKRSRHVRHFPCVREVSFSPESEVVEYYDLPDGSTHVSEPYLAPMMVPDFVPTVSTALPTPSSTTQTISVQTETNDIAYYDSDHDATTDNDEEDDIRWPRERRRGRDRFPPADVGSTSSRA
jgi:hypothetical protein